MKLVIGSKFRGHDASIYAIFPEQGKVFGLSTERITRYKHDRIMPVDALSRFVEYAQSDFDIDPEAVSHVIFCNSFKGIEHSILPENFYTTERLLRLHLKAVYTKQFDEAYAHYEKRSTLGKILDLMTSWHGLHFMAEKLLLWVRIKKLLPIAEIERNILKRFFPHAEIDIRFYDHEYCHVVSALATSRFEEALIWSFDGWGDDNFSKVYTLRDNKLQWSATSAPSSDEPIYGGENNTIHILLSPGGVYTYLTELLGFTPIADEGKVEALAAYGVPDETLVRQFESLVTVNEEKMHLEFHREKAQALLTFPGFGKILSSMSKEDAAASVQRFLERVTLTYATLLVKKTGIKNLVLTGGVAANVINNLHLYERLTPHLHITPAMADDGSSQGAAYAYLLEEGMSVADMRAITMEMPYYSTSYTREEVATALSSLPGIAVRDLGERWPLTAAELLTAGKIGAIFHGKMEYGPRALGNRSIIADPRQKDFRERINLHIKRRPAFQPFCPSILAEEKDRLFESAYLNKHMTCAFRLKKEFWEALPSAIHIDGTARAQFVEEGDNPAYYRLLKRVKELTGFGVVINTSFNKHGRTIVESPKDAVMDFLDTDMDYMIIEGYLVERLT